MSARPALTTALGRRQTEVLALVAQGYSTGEIAARMFISQSTVRQHLKDIYLRLQARSRAHAVHLAHKMGLPEVVGAATHPPDVARRTRLATVKPVALTAEQRKR